MEIAELSGGQMLVLHTTKMLWKAILVLDEPTNHLDIETITWLERVPSKL